MALIVRERLDHCHRSAIHIRFRDRPGEYAPNLAYKLPLAPPLMFEGSLDIRVLEVGGQTSPFFLPAHRRNKFALLACHLQAGRAFDFGDELFKRITVISSALRFGRMLPGAWRGRGFFGAHSPHSIFGFSPLEFLLLYFFSCHERFKEFTEQQDQGAFKLESAMFRLALNVLARLDADEASRALAARLSQKRLSYPGSHRR